MAKGGAATLTLFTVPRAFTGETGMMQRNALRSWRLLPGCRVLMMGNAEGSAAAAAELGVGHEPRVKRNDFGTPLVSDLLARALGLAPQGLLAYVSPETMLLGEFPEAVARVAAMGKRFLMIGRRTDLEVSQRLLFTGNWEAGLRALALEEGRPHGPGGLNYLAFRRDTWTGSIPDFAVGKTMWEPWLVWSAWKRGARVVDASRRVLAIHQQHDEATDLAGPGEDPEVKGNRALAAEHSESGRRGMERNHRGCYTFSDAPLRLGRWGVVPRVWPRKAEREAPRRRAPWAEPR